MSFDLLLPALVGLLPVLTFLAALLYLDSYKLVKLPAVIAVVICGAMVAGISYEANAFVLDLIRIDLPHGMEFELAEIGSASTTLGGVIPLELSDSYGQFNRFRLSGEGIVRSRPPPQAPAG